MRFGSVTLGLVLMSSIARAQFTGSVPELSQIRDDKDLADAIATVTQQPEISVADPKHRRVAAALISEGVRQLRAQAYDQALANFLEAYNKVPNPHILLDIASMLRDIGRLAEAANSYQRYLSDPGADHERVAQIRTQLAGLDAQLTLLNVRVAARGSQVSIDGGPFVIVGSSLQTRVRPGLHVVRVRKRDRSSELTINGFEGETKDVAVAIQADAGPPDDPLTETAESVPDRVEGWLITGTQYTTDRPSGRERRVRSGFNGPELAPIVASDEVNREDAVLVEKPPPVRRISSGVIGLLRIDGKGRGVAGGLGIAFAPLDAVELEVAGLKSAYWGMYLGMRVRVRVLKRRLRPFIGGGVPLFFYRDEGDPEMSMHVALGLRAAAGLELEVHRHLSLQGDIGVEHFFNVDSAVVDGNRLDRTILVPTFGVIGRL